ncbi:MAG: nicotinate (nicotinamide) nucleotide adenylyltransferase [Clostridia bacterium]|nr:nicotinate (nicotinamide) nucleotide adenylyltransferase [Clostridia bacterium]
MREKVGIFGGSFHPPHTSHVLAAERFLQAEQLDRLYVVPAFLPPHKALSRGAGDADRLAMTRLAFAPLGERVTVSTLEVDKRRACYTLETLCEVRDLHPEADLFLYVGGDMLLSFETWHEFEELFRLCTVCTLAREDDEPTLRRHADHLAKTYGARIKLLGSCVPTSSTEVREALFAHRQTDKVPSAVLDYIHTHRLYTREGEISRAQALVRETLSEKRARHVFGVVEEAEALARAFDCSEETVQDLRLLALLHDVTKEKSTQEQLVLCEEWNVALSEDDRQVPKGLHAITAAAFAAREFGLPEELTDALRYHTTGRADMSFFEKVIFLADYIEAGRTYPPCLALRRLFWEGMEKALPEERHAVLNHAVRVGLDMTLQDLAEEGKYVHPDTVDARDFLVSQNF